MVTLPDLESPRSVKTPQPVTPTGVKPNPDIFPDILTGKRFLKIVVAFGRSKTYTYGAIRDLGLFGNAGTTRNETSC